MPPLPCLLGSCKKVMLTQIHHPNWYSRIFLVRSNVYLYRINQPIFNISEKDIMHTLRHIILACFSISFLVVLAACGPATNSVQVQTTSTIDKNFQAQVSPIPTTPPYLCGAWSSNNAPSRYSIITIYVRLPKSIAGVSGATSIAVVHFRDGDQQLDAHPVSDTC